MGSVISSGIMAAGHTDPDAAMPEPHPLSAIISGEVEPWEAILPRENGIDEMS